ncbi:MAG: alpha/beta fold hydrolase [Tetrasphaera sp.]
MGIVIVCDPAGRRRGRVLVIHSWWGLTDSFRRYADSLAAAGFRVVVPDLFGGATAATEEEARRLRARTGRVSRYRLLEEGLDILRAGRDGEPVGVVGFSMGGHWAVWLAQRRGYNIAAACLYYAARAGTFTPPTRYLAHFADADPWVSAAARSRMESAINRSGCTYAAHDYPGCGHWFAESDRPDAYRADAAQLAFSRDLTLLGSVLGG